MKMALGSPLPRQINPVCCLTPFSNFPQIHAHTHIRTRWSTHPDRVKQLALHDKESE